MLQCLCPVLLTCFLGPCTYGSGSPDALGCLPPLAVGTESQPCPVTPNLWDSGLLSERLASERSLRAAEVAPPAYPRPSELPPHLPAGAASMAVWIPQLWCVCEA